MSFLKELRLFLFGKTKAEKAEERRIERELEKENNAILQELEDDSYERFIEKVAKSRFEEWKTAPLHWLFDFTRHMKIYYIYDDETARFKNINLEAVIKEKYENLKNKYLETLKYPDWFDDYYKDNHLNLSDWDTFLPWKLPQQLTTPERELILRKWKK